MNSRWEFQSEKQMKRPYMNLCLKMHGNSVIQFFWIFRAEDEEKVEAQIEREQPRHNGVELSMKKHFFFNFYAPAFW